MDEKLRALALIRASILEDGDAIALMLTQTPVTAELAQHLAGLGASLLEVAIGPVRATATIDRFLRMALEQP